MDCYREIYSAFPDAEIISGVTVFSKDNTLGSVYPDVPFKNKPQKWFYDVNNVIWSKPSLPGVIASHGMFHFDHSKAHRELQEMSIVSSCNFLESNIFIPPFNRFNDDTVSICEENGIRLLTPMQGWKSFEYEVFSPDHKKWYFHSWRFTPKKLREIFQCQFQMD